MDPSKTVNFNILPISRDAHGSEVFWQVSIDKGHWGSVSGGPWDWWIGITVFSEIKCLIVFKQKVSERTKFAGGRVSGNLLHERPTGYGTINN